MMTEGLVALYLKELKFKVIHKLRVEGGSFCGLHSVYNGVKTWKWTTCKRCLSANHE